MTGLVARSAFHLDRTRATAPTYRRVLVDGVRCRYLIAGSGPPLLVVASPLLLARTYLPVVRELASSFTVVVVEPPGSGGSERIEHAWSSGRYGMWLVDFVRRLPLAAPIVIGHSDSAPFVVEAARIAPAELRGIVLVGACGACDPRGIGRVMASRAIDAFGEPLFSLRVTPHLLANALRHPRAFVDHVRAAAHADVEPAARELRTPTLLAWGDRDRTMPLTCASRLGRAIAGAKLVVGTGSHDWIVTRPTAFARALRRFAAGIATAARS